MQPIDLGFVKPAEYGEGLAGLGQVAKEMREAKRAEQGKTALKEAMASKDPQLIAKVQADYPELSEQIKDIQTTERILNVDNARSNAILAMKALNETDVTDRDTMLTLARDELQDAGDPRWQDIDQAIGLPPEEQEMLLNNVIGIAERLKAIEPEDIARGRQGLYQAKTISYKDGSYQTLDPNSGNMRVFDPQGNEVTNDPLKRGLVIKAGNKSGVLYEYDTSYAKKSGEQTARLETEPEIQTRIERAKAAVEASNKLVPEMQKVQRNIANYQKALDAIDKGAETGVIDKLLPSVTEAAQLLDNIQKQLGLDVVGAVTFGALSEGELNLALSVALPTDMQPDALRKWVTDRKAAQEKFLREMQKVNEMMVREGLSPAEVYVRMNSIPKGYTEQDVQDNMNAFSMTRQEVIGQMRKNSGAR
jgi:hypothetical protein